MFESLDDSRKKDLPRYPRWYKPVVLVCALLTMLVSIIHLLRA